MLEYLCTRYHVGVEASVAAVTAMAIFAFLPGSKAYLGIVVSSILYRPYSIEA